MRERQPKQKIYPKLSKDKSLKFVFFDSWRKYTIRFSGNPIFLLEYIYKNKWGKDFLLNYDLLRSHHWGQVSSENKKIMKEAIQLSDYFLSLLDEMGNDWIAPLVVYIDNERDIDLGKGSIMDTDND